MSTSVLRLLRFCVTCSREGFLSCHLPISGPGNRISSHGTCRAETIAVGEALQLANTHDVGDGFPQGAGAMMGEMVDEKRQRRVKS